MTIEEFADTRSESTPPPGLREELLSLWYDAKGDWDQAHKIVQEMGGKNAAWVHAYLHRTEGDLSNSSYWYSRAGRKMSNDSLETEWRQIAAALLAEG